MLDTTEDPSGSSHHTLAWPKANTSAGAALDEREQKRKMQNLRFRCVEHVPLVSTLIQPFSLKGMPLFMEEKFKLMEGKLQPG